MFDFATATEMMEFDHGFDASGADAALAPTRPLPLPTPPAPPDRDGPVAGAGAPGPARWAASASAWNAALPWLHEFVEVVPDAVLVLDALGRVEAANRLAARLFGYPEGGLHGRTVDELMPPRERGALYARQAASRDAGRAAEGFEGHALRADGTGFPMAVSLAPLATPQGQWTTLTVRDITAIKQAEAIRAAMHDDLRTANRELEQFVAVASHDLKAPLRSLQGFARLLERDLPPAVAADPDIADYLAFITKSARHMGALLDGLLLYSRTGRETVPTRPVACGALLDDVQDQLHALLTERQVRLDIGVLPTVQGFPLALNQLFQNLLGNAVKFQPGPSPRVRVWADACPDARGMHTLHVQDWGIGIAAEHQEAVFEIFQRLHDETEFEGTGVGLAVCARIVARHGGRLWLDSVPGEGSTFHFTLPAAAASPAPGPAPGSARI